MPRVNPVAAAIRAREHGALTATCCITTPRLARRTVVWSAAVRRNPCERHALDALRGQGEGRGRHRRSGGGRVAQPDSNGFVWKTDKLTRTRVESQPASVRSPCVRVACHVRDRRRALDLLLELSYREHRAGEQDVFARTWLPLLEAGGVALQVCPIFVELDRQPEGTLREALGQATSFRRAVRDNEGVSARSAERAISTPSNEATASD